MSMFVLDAVTFWPFETESLIRASTQALIYDSHPVPGHLVFLPDLLADSIDVVIVQHELRCENGPDFFGELELVVTRCSWS